MTNKKGISLLAQRILVLGTLLPGAVCAVYIWGLFSGAIYTFCVADALRFARETAEIFICCIAVAVGGACFGDWLQHRG